MSLLGAQLEAFLAVVNRGTVKGAARDVKLTQTGVTQRIRALESQLNATLFLRSRRGMKLTNEGEALLRFCQSVQDLEGEALAHIVRGGKGNIVSVCITGPTSMMRARVIPECFETQKEYPEILFRFDFSDDRTGSDKLRSGSAHLALLPTADVTLEMDSKLLKPQRYLLVGPSPWKGRDLKEVVRNERIVDFSPEDELSFRYLRHFHLFRGVRKERHFVANTDALGEMVALGFGYTVLSEHFARRMIDDGRMIELHPGHTFPSPIALAWYPRPHMPAYFRAVVDSIR